jgi:hypothetical protein
MWSLPVKDKKNSMTAGLQASKWGYISQAEMKLDELA